MNDIQPKSRWRWFRRLLIGSLLGFIVLVLALVVYVHTDSFRDLVHRRLVSALEQMTGGRVELAKFNVVPFRFRVEAHDLTIHGTEASGEIPYAHVDNLIAYIKIISIFESDYGFSSLSLDRPVIHIIVYPNGATNQPSPKLRELQTKSPIQQLFAISIGRLQVTRGELIWNDSRIPLALDASKVSAELNYSFMRRRYESTVGLGDVNTQFRDLPAFRSAINGEFALAENSIDVNSLRWISGRSHLEASGRIADFRNPKFTAAYNGRMDLAEFGPLMGLTQLRAGLMELGGKGTFSASELSAAGQVFGKNLEWRDKVASLRSASIGARYNVTQTRLRITGLQTKLLGGTATGSADVTNWLNLNSTSGKASRSAGNEQVGNLNLEFSDISVSALSAAFTSRKMPLDRLKLTGASNGTLQAKWRGRPQDADAVFSFEVNPPAQAGPGQIPVNARGAGTYFGRAEELQLADLTVVTRATQLHASGRLSRSSSLRIAASTTNISEWQPILNSFGGPQIPIALHGRAIFNGTANGKLSDFTIAGHVHMNDFDTLFPASAGRPGQQVHWDYLTTDVKASPRMISARNGTLTSGPMTIQFQTTAMLVNGTLALFSPFTARVHILNGDVASLQRAAGYNYPISGRMDLTLNASGTRLSPHAEGHVQLSDAVLYGERVPLFTSDLRFNGEEAQLTSFVLSYRNSRITGAAAYNPNTRQFRLNAIGSDFDLRQFAKLQQGSIPVEGRMDFTAEGGGTLDEPVINANLRLHDLTLDHERAGDFTIDAVTRGPDLQLTGRSNFEKAELAVDGTVRLRENWPADLTLRFDHLDVDALLRAYLHNRVTGHSAMAGVIRLQGPLREPRLLSATADLTSVYANVENVVVQNEGPVRFSVKNQLLSLDQLRLIGEGTDVTAVGTVHLAGERELDIRADGNVNMKLLENFSPDLSSSGAIKIGVKVSGTYSFPSLLGRVDVINGAVASNNLPNGLSDMNGVLLFNQDRLQIQTLTAHVGGGTVDLTGYMAYTPHLSFNIAAHGTGVRLRPAGISATADADLKLTGTTKDAVLSGDITVVKLALSPGFDFARYLEASKQTTSLPQANTLLNKVRLDVHVTTTPELQMQSTLAKLSGDADLRLRGTMVRPVVLGRVDIMEGNIYFSGTKYRLERGEITFTGPVGIKPTLDLEATTHVRDYDITLGVNGTPEKLSFTYRSEPPLPEPDIIALLALGRTQSESASLAGGSSQTAFSQEASNVILNQALNATLNNRAQRLFGISRIKIDPQGLNTETSPTRSAPAVTIEQQVSSNLTLTYTTEVSQTSQQIIQGEYNVTRNVSILAVRDQNGVVSFDVRLRQRRK